MYLSVNAVTVNSEQFYVDSYVVVTAEVPVNSHINGMISKLEKEAEEEADQKEFCDKGLKEANEKKDVIFNS